VSGILKEFQNCQNLKHSSIVKNYDMVQDPGCYYIIMEMCDSDLNKRLLQRKLTNDEIYNIMVETASALRYMQALSKDRLIQMSLTGTSNLKIYSSRTGRSGYPTSESPKMTAKHSRQTLELPAIRLLRCQMLLEPTRENAMCSRWASFCMKCATGRSLLGQLDGVPFFRISIS
jgi:hypothetical protein